MLARVPLFGTSPISWPNDFLVPGGVVLILFVQRVGHFGPVETIGALDREVGVFLEISFFGVVVRSGTCES